MNTKIKAQLARFRAGRVLLHLACLFRHPSHSRWHCRGILREFEA